jgi:hypothetical protein
LRDDSEGASSDAKSDDLGIRTACDFSEFYYNGREHCHFGGRRGGRVLLLE